MLKPDVLRGDAKFSEFRDWREKFEDWYRASEMTRLDADMQEAYLRGCLSDEARHVLRYYLAVPAGTPVPQALNRLEAYFETEDSVVHRRQRWYALCQLDHESY